MGIAAKLQPILTEIENLPANQDFDLLVVSAWKDLSAGVPLNGVMYNLVTTQGLEQRLAMVIAAVAESLAAKL